MVDDQNTDSRLNNLEEVVSEPLKFKAKLKIGDKAYGSLQKIHNLREVWDIVGAAWTGASVASSTAVAAFFSNGIMVALGLASTPIGWVIGASILSAGTWYGFSRLIQNHTKNNVDVIPRFINTPMDILALKLFDLMAPLALKIASADGKIHNAERTHIQNYFIHEWGYNPEFIAQGIEFTESKLPEFETEKVAQSLVEFQKANKDCNFNEMSKEIYVFLSEVTEADGKIDGQQKQEINKIKKIFTNANKCSIKKSIRSVFSLTKGKTLNDEINQRLEQATPTEIAHMRELLGLKPSKDVHKIICKYRLAAGNPIINIIRRVNLADDLSYKEILILALKSVCPLKENILTYLRKITEVFNRIDTLEDHRVEYEIISGLEQALLERVEEDSKKPAKFVQATIEMIMIGRRQAAEIEELE